MVRHCNRHQRIYVANQLMDTFFGTFWKILCWERISFWNIDWKMLFLGTFFIVNPMQNQVRSIKWHSAINRSMRSPIGHPWWSISAFKAAFCWLEFWTFYLKFYTVSLCWKTVWVGSFCKLHTFIIFHTVIFSQSYKISFIYFTNWLNAGALLQLAEPDWWNWSQDEDNILGLADRLCHTT